MILRVDTHSAIPPYEQIRAQVSAMIGAGVLSEGTRLPAIRHLAGDLEIAAGTVARAYSELERDGFVVTRGRHGTFVESDGKRPAPAEAKRQLRETAHAYALQARQLGVDARTALAMAKKALAAIRPGS